MPRVVGGIARTLPYALSLLTGAQSTAGSTPYLTNLALENLVRRLSYLPRARFLCRAHRDVK
jgi:hypothetical protein